MLFRQDILQGIAEGRVTLAFRRWRRMPPANGSSFRSLWSKEDQNLIAGLSGDVFALRSGAVLSVVGLTRSGRKNNFEFLLLPLEGGQRTTPRCLGAVSACRKPFWLGADPIIETRVEAVRIVDPESDPKSPIDRMEVGAPTLTPNATFYTDSEPAPFSGRRIRHLVVSRRRATSIGCAHYCSPILSA